MLCSLPNAKSSSSWLDRLHTLKGFNNPAPPNPSPDADPISHKSSPNSTSASTSAQMRPVDAMSSILADLFVMDPPNPAGIGAKRGLRKQPSPRICIVSRTRKSRGFPPPSASNGVTELKGKKRTNKLKVNKKNKQAKNRNKEKEKEKKGAETGSGSGSIVSPTASKVVPGFKGRTEATVIDTSTPGWKSAKILIRKGSIWKVRDKKQWNAGLKKRKRFGLSSNKEKETVALEEASDALDQGDNREEPVDPIQVSVKRLKCSKLPSVPEAAKSIALHLKVRTNGKKKGLSISNNSPTEKVQP